MNQKAEFNLQGMWISLLIVGLFFGIIGSAITILSSNYETTGYDQNDINSFNKNKNLTRAISTVQDDVDNVVVESSWYDFFSGIWSKILIPFKTVYRSLSTLQLLTREATQRLHVMPILTDFLITVTTILVIIGIVMIKFHLGRQK